MILKPIDQLVIAGGARYTHETKASTLFNIAEHGRASFPYGKGFTDHQTFNNVSPEVTVAYHYSPDLTFFVGYRTGYKSGGFALSSTINAASVPSHFDRSEERRGGEEWVSTFRLGLST